MLHKSMAFLLLLPAVVAFTVQPRCSAVKPTALTLFSTPADNDDSKTDSDGADLAAELFKMAQQKGVQIDSNDIDEEEEDDDDDDDDETEMNYPAGAVNAFLGYDTGGKDVGDLAGNVTLTDEKLYNEVKERVLDTAGGFVDYVRKSQEDDDEDEDEDDEDEDEDELVLAGDSDMLQQPPKPYEPPETVPDADLTAGEVVELVLAALLNNDNPTKNRGVEILFDYSSPGSSIKNEDGLTPAEYADFLKETEYKVLFDHQGVSIDKADYGFEGKKAFFTARLKVGPGPMDGVSVNFILSTTGREDCWLIDSMLIRPQSMRRRRRK